MSGRNPVSVKGELFLSGPDEERVKVSCDREFALALCRIIDRGHAACDCKDQGIGYLKLTYESGEQDTLEIMNTGLVRIKGGGIIQTDLSELMPLLQRAVKEASEVSSGIRDQVQRLVAAAETGEAARYHRVIQELGTLAAESPEAREALIRFLFARPEGAPWFSDQWVAKAVAGTGRSSVTAITGRLWKGKAAPEKRELQKALTTFGLMGAEAKEAVPFLLKEIKKYAPSSEMRGRILAVLANTGFASPANLQELQSDIKKRNAGGKAAVAMLAQIGPGDWVNAKTTSALTEWLSQPLDDSTANAALVIATLRDRGGTAFDRLQRLLTLTKRDDHWSSFRAIFAFSLSRIAPAKQAEFLWLALEYSGDIQNHTDWSAILVIASLASPEETIAIGQMLDDRDPKVVAGAMRILWAIGLPAGEATPKLIEIAETAKEAKQRQTAAFALAAVAPPSELPRLEALLRHEKSSDVRETLENAPKAEPTDYCLETSIHGWQVDIRVNSVPVARGREGLPILASILPYVVNGKNVVTLRAERLGKPRMPYDDLRMGITKRNEYFKVLEKSVWFIHQYKDQDVPRGTKVEKTFEFQAAMPVKWTWQSAEVIRSLSADDKKAIKAEIARLHHALKKKDYATVDACFEISDRDGARYYGKEANALREWRRKAFAKYLDDPTHKVKAIEEDKIEMEVCGQLVHVHEKGWGQPSGAGLVAVTVAGRGKGQTSQSLELEFLVFCKLGGRWRIAIR